MNLIRQRIRKHWRPDLEVEPSETSVHKPSAIPNSNQKNETLASSPSKPYVNEVTVNEGARNAEFHANNIPVNDGFIITS